MARPRGAKQKGPLSNWLKIGTVLSPEAIEFLRGKKRAGFKVNLIINRAILELKKHDQGE
jgi:hypothetical protein